jgi:hypothetical protein
MGARRGRPQRSGIAVLGLPHLYTYGDLAFFDCGGVRLFLSEGNGEIGDHSRTRTVTSWRSCPK